MSSPDESVLAALSLVEKRGAIAAAKSIYTEATPSEWGDKEFSVAALRATAWAEALINFLDQFEREQAPIDYFAIESFVDQRSRAREDKNRLVRNRWQTPLVIGLVQAALARREVTVANGRLVYQNAGIVIRQQADEIARLKVGGFIPGDHLIKNDHQRKALAHALALSLRLQNQLHNQPEIKK